VADPYVPVGARSFRLDSTAGLDVGDTIVVHRPSTQAWINAIGMNKLENPWQPGTKDLVFDRIITRIEGNWITIDAPLTNSLDQKYGGGSVYEYARPGRIENVGIEHIRGVSTFKARPTRTTRGRSSRFHDAERLGEGHHHANFAMPRQHSANSKWVTVEDAQFLDPKSQVTGGRRYPFYIEGQQNLVKNAFAKSSRHDFVVGALAAGPNVFVDCWAQYSSNDSGPHHRWSVGTLLDNVTIPATRSASAIAGTWARATAGPGRTTSFGLQSQQLHRPESAHRSELADRLIGSASGVDSGTHGTRVHAAEPLLRSARRAQPSRTWKPAVLAGGYRRPE
jgi:hypothetical protein